jgi:integrase
LRDRKANLNFAKADDLVFRSRSGTAIRPDNVLKRFIYPACDRLKMPRAGWHTFRRTHATLLNENGENPKTTQAILGHSDLETTMHHYIHAVPQTMFEAEERLAVSLMDSTGPKSKKAVSLKTEEALWIQYERPET